MLSRIHGFSILHLTVLLSSSQGLMSVLITIGCLPEHARLHAITVTYQTGCIFYSAGNLLEAPPRKCPTGPHQPIFSSHQKPLWLSVLSQDFELIIGKEYGLARIDLTNQVQLLKMWSEYKSLSLSQSCWYTVNIRETTPLTVILASLILMRVIDETQDFCICFSFSLKHLSLRTFSHTHLAFYQDQF